MEKVRVSCIAFARITDNQGRFALFRNNRYSTAAQVMVSPFGGALNATPVGLNYIKHQFKLQNSDFERFPKPDLRMYVDREQLHRVGRWFSQQRDAHREVSSLREVLEELIDESKALDAGELEGTVEQFRGEHFSRTPAIGEEPEKVRYYEVFDVLLPPAARQKLVLAAQRPDAVVYFATADEILAGTVGGASIPECCELLLK